MNTGKNFGPHCEAGFNKRPLTTRGIKKGPNLKRTLSKKHKKKKLKTKDRLQDGIDPKRKEKRKVWNKKKWNGNIEKKRHGKYVINCYHNRNGYN